MRCQMPGSPLKRQRKAGVSDPVTGELRIPELSVHFAAGVTHVFSILGPTAPDPPEFAAFAPHRRLILRFHDVIEPLPNQIAPTGEDVERLLVFGREVSETPEAHLLVHCRAGVSRSTAAAALILMQANPEWPASAALDANRRDPAARLAQPVDPRVRRRAIEPQRRDRRRAGAIYRRVLARDTEFVDQMIYAGRQREVSAAYRETG